MRPVALIGPLLLALVPVASAAAPPAAELESAVAGSGGSIAQPLRQGDGGGGVAPRPAPADPEQSAMGEAVAIGEAVTIAAPGQDQATIPEGEQQTEQSEPPTERQQPVDVEEEEETGQRITLPVETDVGDGGSEQAGFAGDVLPGTGLGLVLLGVIGLGLLGASVSIRRPRRSALSR